MECSSSFDKAVEKAKSFARGGVSSVQEGKEHLSLSDKRGGLDFTENKVPNFVSLGGPIMGHILLKDKGNFQGRRKKMIFKKICLFNGPCKKAVSMTRRNKGSAGPRCVPLELRLESISDQLSQFSKREFLECGSINDFHGDILMRTIL